MEAHPCAGAYIITADMEFEAHYGRRAAKRRKMYNGMIPCQVYMYYSAPGAKAQSPCRPSRRTVLTDAGAIRTLKTVLKRAAKAPVQTNDGEMTLKKRGKYIKKWR